MKAMDFGGAIQCMMAGGTAYRGAWANGVFLAIQKPDDHSKMTQPYIYRQQGEMDGGKCVPWVPAQEDMLADDWVAGVG
jgi:Protein of unknown function (DUF2829)